MAYKKTHNSTEHKVKIIYLQVKPSCTVDVISQSFWATVAFLTVCFIMQDLRLPSVTTIAIPEGYDWRELLVYIMKNHNMEMTGGLGPSIGMVR